MDRRGWTEALGNVRVQFWTCLNEAHRTVTWTGDVASCDTCGLTSEMTSRFAIAVRDYERERIRKRAEVSRATFLADRDGTQYEVPFASAIDPLPEDPSSNPLTRTEGSTPPC